VVALPIPDHIGVLSFDMSESDRELLKRSARKAMKEFLQDARLDKCLSGSGNSIV